VPRKASRQEIDLPLRELRRQILQLVPDAEIHVVQLHLDPPAERHPGRRVGDPVAQLHRARPVRRHRSRLLEAGRAVAQVGELDVEGARGVPLDVDVAGLPGRIHGTALEDVHERVRVAGEVGEDVATGPAGEP